MNQAQLDFLDAVGTSATVTIRTTSDRILTGTPVETDNHDVYKIVTGRRGRPAHVDLEDVAEVTFE